MVNVTAEPSDCLKDTNSRFLGCVWITGGSAVTEGGDAAFTVHAHPAPRDKLVVRVRVADSTFKVRSRYKGSRAVAIPKGQTSTTFMVPTWDDGMHEADGEVTAGLWNRVAEGGTGSDWFYYWEARAERGGGDGAGQRPRAAGEDVFGARVVRAVDGVDHGGRRRPVGGRHGQPVQGVQGSRRGGAPLFGLLLQRGAAQPQP